MDGWVVVGVRLDEDVGVGGFAEDFSQKATVVIPGHMYIKEGNAIIFLGLTREFYTRVDAVENVVERFRRIHVIGGTTEAGMSGG